MSNRTKLGVTRPLAFIMIYILQLIGGIIFLISDPHDREIRFHSLMSCYLCITMIISWIILGLLAKIAFIGWSFKLGLWIAFTAYVCTMLLSMFRALNGSRLKVPFFYQMADRRS